MPTSILRNEILPRIDRDPGYLQREDMGIVAGTSAVGSTVDAAALSGLRNGSLRVRQRPGPKNVLDGVKFVLRRAIHSFASGATAGSVAGPDITSHSHGSRYHGAEFLTAIRSNLAAGPHSSLPRAGNRRSTMQAVGAMYNYNVVRMSNDAHDSR